MLFSVANSIHITEPYEYLLSDLEFFSFSFRWLYQHGANFQVTDECGNTLLHMIPIPFSEDSEEELQSYISDGAASNRRLSTSSSASNELKRLRNKSKQKFSEEKEENANTMTRSMRSSSLCVDSPFKFGPYGRETRRESSSCTSVDTGDESEPIVSSTKCRADFPDSGSPKKRPLESTTVDQSPKNKLTGEVKDQHKDSADKDGNSEILECLGGTFRLDKGINR